jgi:glycosyltransferase involved in cell wall biosynthesis
MRILFILQDVPVGRFDGNKLKIANLLTALSREHQIDIIGYVDGVDPSSHIANIETLYKCRILALFDRNRGSMLTLMRVRETVCGRRLPSFARWNKADVRRAISTAVQATRYDLVHFDLINMAYFYNEVRDVPTVLSICDSVSMRYFRRGKWEMRFHQRIINAILWRRMMSEERRVLKKFDAVHVVSEVDKQWLVKTSNLENVHVVSVAVEPQYVRAGLASTSTKTLTLVTCGDLAEPHIREPLRDFLRLQWGALVDVCPKLRLVIIGRRKRRCLVPEIEVARNTEYFEWSDNYEQMLRSSAMAVFFDSGGSGVKNRVLQAMAVGTACLGTKFAFEGINSENGVNCLIDEETHRFGRTIQDALDSGARLDAIRRAAETYVRANHSSEIIAAQWMALYRRVARRRQ